MRECKDCRHCLAFPLLTNNAFARCVAPETRGSLWSDCFTHRIFDACEETDCGSEGRFFEPLPLGRSHGIDWDRARKRVDARWLLDEIERLVKEACKASSDELLSNPRPRFTIAEYLAALTTDYCAARAAE
jgi:hypothetical protein